ncbi:LLM class flavin-dependent oxidoreductase [Micrococcales bacterium 31B]|nr:LLM class flavin-dependent oxidoreductase [Micrococcales bacterium 31B]
MAPKLIRLNAFDMTCVVHQSPGLWRLPGDRATEYNTVKYWTDLARLLERGLFEGMFIADVVGIYDVYQGGPETAVKTGTQVPVGDPRLAISAMAAVTEHLGFGVTVSTTYAKPYLLARDFSTLDHLTGGRVAWNIVTSYLDSAARNLGLDQQVSHDRRYDVANEFLEVCYKLWESSWEDDAVVKDSATGVYADPTKVHAIEHAGEHFTVPGVHLCEPSPQRTPVIYQAGFSSKGRAFAARHAEGIFVAAPRAGLITPHVAAIREAAAAEGRDPQSVKFFALVTVIVAETDADARAKEVEYRRYVSHESALTLFAGWTGVDLSKYGLDEVLQMEQNEAIHSALQTFTQDDAAQQWTPRKVAELVAIGGVGPLFVGSPKTVADQLEAFLDETDIDGFNLAYATTPGSFEDFIDLVVPELQARGRYRTAYEGSTLRESFYGAGQQHVRTDHPAFGYKVTRALV